MQSLLDVRVAGPDDIPVLAAIGSAVFRDTYGGTAPEKNIARHVESYFGESAVSAEMLRPQVTYLMAVEKGHCAGLVKMRDSEIPALVPADSAVEVQQLYVSVDFQRRGIGNLLMDEVTKAVRTRGIAGIWLRSWSEADWATAFYTKYGFTSLGKTTFEVAGTHFIDNMMWLPLDG